MDDWSELGANGQFPGAELELERASVKSGVIKKSQRSGEEAGESPSEENWSGEVTHIGGRLQLVYSFFFLQICTMFLQFFSYLIFLPC